MLVKYFISWLQVREGVLTEETHGEYVKNMGSDVNKDLQTKIKEAIEKRPTLDSVTSEIVSHVSFCARKSASFYGRADLVQASMKYYTGNEGRVNSARTRSGNNTETVFVVHGVSGSGKTSLMAKVVSTVRQMFQDKKSFPVMVTRFCGTSGASSSARNLLYSICEQIARACPLNEKGMKDLNPAQLKEATKPVPTSFQELVPYFASLLKRATTDKPLVIHIDSLDQLSDEDNGRSKLDWLPFNLPPNVYLMVSTLPKIGGCLQYLKQKSIPPSNFLEVGKLTKNDVGMILKGWLDENKRKLQKFQFDFVLKVALDESKEQPTPLRLRLLSDIALKWTSYDKLPADLPATVEGLIDTIFTSLEKNHGQLLMSAFCGLLAVSKQGISENDLVDIMSTDDELLDSVLQYHKPPVKRIPYHLVARLKFDLRNYLVDRGEYNKTVLYWFHRQFWQCAENKYLKVGTPQEGDQKDKYALLVIKYFSEEAHKVFKGDKNRGLTGQPLYWKSKNGDVNFNLARLTELPSATCKGSQKLHEMYKHSLSNLGFIAAKCAAGKAIELASDYDASLKNSSDEKLKQYRRFMRENAHILDKDAGVILQELLNASDAMKDIRDDVTKIKKEDVLPWMKESDIPTPCDIVNKSAGDNPILMTIPGEPAEEYVNVRYAQISCVTVGKRTFVVMAYDSDQSSVVQKDDSKSGSFIHIYDASSGAKLLKLRLGSRNEGRIGSIGTVPCVKNSFILLYNRIPSGYDDQKSKCVHVYCKVISVGETLMALDGPSIPMLPNPAEEIVKPSSSWYLSNGKTVLITFNCQQKETDAFGQPKDEASQKITQTALKVWDLSSCLKAKKTDQLVPICCKNKDFVITKGLENNLTVQDASRFISFSPHDKFLVVSVQGRDKWNHSYMLLTVLNSKTLEPVWTWNHNRKVFCKFYGTETCVIPGHDDLWLIIWQDLYVGVTSLVIQEKGSDVEGTLGWSSYSSKHVTGLSAMPIKSGSIYIFGKMEESLHMWRISSKDIKKKKMPPTTLIDCKVITELPKISHLGGRQMIGTTIEELHITGSTCYSLSKEGEIKVTDLALLLNYKQADKIDDPVSVCRPSPDGSSVIVAGGSKVACFDAKTGELKSTMDTVRYGSVSSERINHLVPFNKDVMFAKTDRGISGSSGLIPMTIFGQTSSEHSFISEQGNGTFVLELCTSPAKPENKYKYSGDHDKKLWSSDLSVSYDRKWICKPPSESRANWANGDRHGWSSDPPEQEKYDTKSSSGSAPTESSSGALLQNSGGSKLGTLGSNGGVLFNSAGLAGGSPQNDAESNGGGSSTRGGVQSNLGSEGSGSLQKGGNLKGGGGTSRGLGGSRGEGAAKMVGGVRTRGAMNFDQASPGDDPSKYPHSLLLTLVNTETGETKDVVIHRYENGHKFKISHPFNINQYKGTFSHSGKYFAAWGNIKINKETTGRFNKYIPPYIKLYDFSASGDLRELSKIDDENIMEAYKQEKPTKLTSLYFLPGDKYLLSTTVDGRVQIRGPLPELSVTTEHVTNQSHITDSHMVHDATNQYLVTCSEDRCLRVWKINQNPLQICNVARYHNSTDIASVCGILEEKEKVLYVHCGDISGAVKILKLKM